MLSLASLAAHLICRSTGLTPVSSDADSSPQPVTVLLLGEGNFSFALALCRLLHSRDSDKSVGI